MRTDRWPPTFRATPALAAAAIALLPAAQARAQVPPPPAAAPAPPPAAAPAPPPAAVPAPPGAAAPAPPGAMPPPPAGWGPPPSGAPGDPGMPPPYYYPPPPPPWANPKTIEYEEGDPIPPGYELKSRSSRGLIIAGLTTFGAPYVFTLVVTTSILTGDDNNEEFAPLLIPVAGPFITISTSDAEGAGTFWLAVDGVIQATGIILLTAGLVSDNPYLARQETAGARREVETPLLRPAVSIGPTSAALRWRF